MSNKKVFYSELSYVLGMIVLALGTALMERANFGMSMVVAPAYQVFLKISQTVPAFTFGMAEYCFQAVLLVLLAAALRRFRPMYLFSFITAVLYGLTLDTMIALASLVPFTGFAWRIVYFIVGMLLCSVGVALLFHTYIAPEAYELFVKELVAKYGWEVGRTKTIYDCISCLSAVILSFCFFGFGNFGAVGFGTVLCALINGRIIAFCGKWLDKSFEFRDALPLGKYFR